VAEHRDDLALAPERLDVTTQRRDRVVLAALDAGERNLRRLR
jgi:hypothetical protein